ncbi:MAG TPA: SURF1 family protein [Oleiagrimonas sp.]|nr:SURF1 family protein [Oleiagrimonas sp.]
MRHVVRGRGGAGGVMRFRRPTWWAVALTLAGVAIFVRLGVWQLHRADYKEHLLHLFATAATAPLVPFGTVEHGVSDNVYPHVGVRGRFVPDRYYLLDDKTHANRVGVEVYAPFKVHGSARWLLVDLGFLPRTRNNDLPHLPPLKSGEVTVTGLYARPPREGLKLGGNQLPKQAHWPKLSIYIDLGQIGTDLGRTLFPRVLLMDADPATVYVRQWVPDTMPPSRHRAYAFQWFTFAAAAIAIFLILHRRRPRKKRQPHE